MSATFVVTCFSKLGRVPIDNSRLASIHRFVSWLRGFAGGAHSSENTIICRNNAVAASGTVTMATPVAGNTVTLGGVVFTAVASGATGNQFNTGGGNNAAATSLAAAINASSTAGVVGCVTASASSAVVTITAAIPGKIGNAITLASSGATVAVSGARLANGAEDTVITITKTAP